MITVKNEPIFYLILVIIALLHIAFGRIANIYDRKIYQVHNMDDAAWLAIVKPYVDMTASYSIASILAFLVFVIAIVVVYGFKNASLPIFGLVIFSVIYMVIDTKKTAEMFGEELVIETEERLVKLLSIEKEKKK